MGRNKVCKQDKDILVQKASGASIVGVLQGIKKKQSSVNVTFALLYMQTEHLQGKMHVTLVTIAVIQRFLSAKETECLNSL